MAYAWFLLELWVREPAVRWIPLVTAAGLGIVGFQRLLRGVVPAFLSGVVALARRQSGGGL